MTVERMRTFLRLDFLYHQALYHEEREDQPERGTHWNAAILGCAAQKGKVEGVPLVGGETQSTVNGASFAMPIRVAEAHVHRPHDVQRLATDGRPRVAVR